LAFWTPRGSRDPRLRTTALDEMQPIVTDVRGVCPSISQSVCLSITNAPNYLTQRSRLETWLQGAGSFGAAFAKLLWPPVL